MHYLEDHDSAVWTLWTREIAESFAHEDIRSAVESFYPVDKPAGRAAADWLVSGALDEASMTETWLRHSDGRLDGFLAACRSSISLQGQTLRERVASGDRRPATEIKWLCKHAETDFPGRELFLRAVAIAAKTWGTNADAVIVINPYDEETAAMLRNKYVFWPSSEDGRLWIPLP